MNEAPCTKLMIEYRMKSVVDNPKMIMFKKGKIGECKECFLSCSCFEQGGIIRFLQDLHNDFLRLKHKASQHNFAIKRR